MTRPQLIKYISQNKGENESWGNLVTKKKVELEQIYEYLVKVNEFSVDNGLGEVQLGGNPDLPETEITGEHIIPIELETEEEEVVKEVITPKPKSKKIIGDGQEYTTMNKKPSALSMSEQKLYARTGRLPKVKVKVNKYTRFDDDDVKFGF